MIATEPGAPDIGESGVAAGATTPACRHCGAQLRHTVVDLGSSPLCNTLLDARSLQEAESFYPLHARVCSECFLVQVGSLAAPETIFSEYSYFSSYSDSWVEHARRYAEAMIERCGLTRDSTVMEVASNDGYLLQHFTAREIPVLGIEPALNVAEAARRKGIPTETEFLGSATAAAIRKRYGGADLVAANNVMAHTPHLNDFVAGMAALLKPGGVLTVEFPHVLRLLQENQFDTIYHEHFSYFSFYTAQRVLASRGLRIFDVEELSTHGGSLRIYAAAAGGSQHSETARVAAMRELEREHGIDDVATYANFTQRVEETKRDLLDCLIAARRAGKRIVGYGAAGKGATLLNYCGIRTDLLDYVVDRNPYKQGRFTPGTRIPILAPERIRETRPDYILVIPWNLTDEIVRQVDYARAWGAKFIVPIPRVRILD